MSKLPDGPEWTYEIKLDGYRLEVVRNGRITTLYSRRENVFNQRFPYIATALQDLPNETAIDGELVALGPDGRPDFHLLQNFRSAESRIVYYAFDILVHAFRQPSRTSRRPVGPGPHCGEDEGMCLGATGGGRGDSVSGMDRGGSSETHETYWAQRGQGTSKII